MLRPSLTTAAIVLLGASAMAQGDLKSRLRPVTSQPKRIGVYHVATGQWSRNANYENVTGPDTIYNNTCNNGYYGGQVTNEKWQHRSRVPSPSGPTTDSIFYPGTKKDEAPGCQPQYTVNGFEIAYCSNINSSGGYTLTYRYDWANSYTLCGGGPLVPTYTVTVTGLPVGTTTGTQNCWIGTIDLTGVTPAFVLAADGDGSYVGPSTSEQFGWSLGPTSTGVTGNGTGPLLTGNYTWTGGPVVGALVPCAGTEGTIWDNPVDLTEDGTGMASNDFFRIEGGTVAAGCYYFGGIVHADFHLELYAAAGCVPPDPLTHFCFPGQGGVRTCPCANPPTDPSRGCNNFQGSGPVDSARMDGSGVASISNDTFVTTTSGENSTSLSIVTQGPSTIAAGTQFGAGVRCVGGALKRLYTKAAVAGVVVAPSGSDLNVHTRSANLGDPLSAGLTRHYFTYYRDPGASGPCGSSLSTFNCSTAGSLTWQP